MKIESVITLLSAICFLFNNEHVEVKDDEISLYDRNGICRFRIEKEGMKYYVLTKHIRHKDSYWEQIASGTYNQVLNFLLKREGIGPKKLNINFEM